MTRTGSHAVRTNLELRTVRRLTGLVVLAAGAVLPVVTWFGDLPPLPWPLVLLWAAVGWGATVGGIAPAIGVAALGLVYDLFSGAPLGLSAVAGVAAYLFAFLGAPYLARSAGGPVIFSFALVSALGLATALGARLLTVGGSPAVEDVLLCWIATVVLFPVFGRLYFETRMEQRRWERGT
jgi:hypothetical protein